MKILYKIICVSALSLFLAGCAKDDTASLQFNIEGAGNREIILSKLSVNRIDVVDTLKTDAGGAARYEAAVAADAPEFFYVSYNRKRLASLIVKGGDKITVNVDTLGSSLTVKGSDESVLLSEIEKEIYDLCIPFRASYPEGVIERRRSEGKVTTYYTCCAEAYPNTFMASSPSEASWIAWRALAADCDGYLRWAYNSWTEDPVRDARFRTWAAGDCYLVYPEGRSSVRMERLAEGIQDCEKIRILSEEWHASGDEKKLSALKDVLAGFTFAELSNEGAEKAVIRAKCFLRDCVNSEKKD